MKIFTTLVPVFCVFLLSGCGKQTSTQPPANASPSAAPVKTAAATESSVLKGNALIHGKVILQGLKPRISAINFSADAYCTANHSQPVHSPTVVVNENGTLKNAFVYVKSGLGGQSFPAPKKTVVLDQRGCMYQPHVFGLMVGQPLEVLNSDDTLHNVHALAGVNPEFNKGQPVKGMKFTQRFAKPDVMVKFKCDVHPWMNAYAGVLDHPFFSVTDDEGSFRIESLPAATYTIEAWHEKYGTTSMDVTIGVGETKEITFEFKNE